MRHIRKIFHTYFKSYRKSGIFFVIVFNVLFVCCITNGLSFDSNEAHMITLDDATINPVTADYIIKSIDAASEEGARCLIIKLDTPGGLLNSTRSIVKKMMSADIPVIVYIAPSGSRAGSAGVFITYASHVAAMAPSTNIGAAHPVDLGGSGGRWKKLKDVFKGKEEATEDKDALKTTEKEKENVTREDDEDPMKSKILQDTVAFIRAIAKERNRNEEWAIASVTESLSIPEQEALDKGVVEIIAKNEQDLLAQLDGRVIKINNSERVLETKDAVIVNKPMDFRRSFLNVLANPNIAYIFMILGFYGLLYEVTHPGIGVPGILGLIFLILAFYSMQTLPTNYAGLALIILSLLLFVAEAYVPGLGLLTLGGVVCMVLGSLLLFDSSVPAMRVSFSVIGAFTLTTALITILLVRLVIKSHSLRTMTGQKGLIGETGVVRMPIAQNQEGKVFVHGELWNAASDDAITAGEKVTITETEGMTLKVKKVS